jgi:hypothetical protein
MWFVVREGWITAGSFDNIVVALGIVLLLNFGVSITGMLQPAGRVYATVAFIMSLCGILLAPGLALG